MPHLHLVVVVVVVVVVVDKVICSPTLTVNNSHERARVESYALVKSSVLSIDGEMQRQTVLVVAK